MLKELEREFEKLGYTCLLYDGLKNLAVYDDEDTYKVCDVYLDKYDNVLIIIYNDNVMCSHIYLNDIADVHQLVHDVIVLGGD